MLEQDMRTLTEFLDILEKRLVRIIDNEDQLIPDQFLRDVRLAWIEVQPNFASVRAVIRDLSLERDGPEFDRRGLSGQQLALKMTLIKAAEALIVQAQKGPPFSLRLRHMMWGALSGALIGTLPVSAELWSYLFTQPDMFTIVLASAGVGAVAGGVVSSVKRGGKWLLRKVIRLFFKPANTVLGSIAAALGHASTPGIPSPAALGAGALAEGVKELKEMVETAMDHAEHWEQVGGAV